MGYNTLIVTHIGIPGKVVEVPPINVTVNGVDAYIDDEGILSCYSDLNKLSAHYDITYEDGSTSEKDVIIIKQNDGKMNLLKIMPSSKRVVTDVTATVTE